MDLSDTAFLRRHRFPEVLEKRSKRRERERLVHERFKLKHTIERLRSGDGIQHLLPTAILRTVEGQGREHKARQIERSRRELLEEAEETIRRIDELLKPRSTIGLPSQAASDAPLAKISRRARASFNSLDSPSESLALPSVETSSDVHKKMGTKRAQITRSSMTPSTNGSSQSKRPFESFFKSQALRDQLFPSLPSHEHSSRKSVRTTWAFGAKVPDACNTVRYFDDAGILLNAEMRSRA